MSKHGGTPAAATKGLEAQDKWEEALSSTVRKPLKGIFHPMSNRKLSNSLGAQDTGSCLLHIKRKGTCS